MWCAGWLVGTGNASSAYSARQKIEQVDLSIYLWIHLSIYLYIDWFEERHAVRWVTGRDGGTHLALKRTAENRASRSLYEHIYLFIYILIDLKRERSRAGWLVGMGERIQRWSARQKIEQVDLSISLSIYAYIHLSIYMYWYEERNGTVPADKSWDVVSATRRSSGVAPRACVRVCWCRRIFTYTYVHTTYCRVMFKDLRVTWRRRRQIVVALQEEVGECGPKIGACKKKKKNSAFVVWMVCHEGFTQNKGYTDRHGDTHTVKLLA